ncbi:dihydrofolate reductase [Leifsonia sp. 563]
MGAIAVHEFVSLDGVFEDPSWTFEFGFDPDMGDDIGRITRASDAILLGRRTFEMFAPAWSPRTADDDPGAPFFNDSPKGVVSSTLDDQTAERTWRNSRSLGAYDAERIRAFADEFSGGVYISGSGSLGAGPAGRRTRRLAPSVRLSAGPWDGRTPVPRGKRAR